MTARKFAFIALGLLLGVATGVALRDVLRARSAARREVRGTVARSAVARRRSATVADDAANAGPFEPAGDGPDDGRPTDRDMPPDDVATSLAHSHDGRPTGGGGRRRSGADRRKRAPAGSDPAFRLAGVGAGSVGIAIAREPDPMMTALRAAATASTPVLMPSGIVSSANGAIWHASVATVPQLESVEVAPAAASAAAGAAGTASDGATSEGPSAEGATGERTGADMPAQGAGPARADADSIAGACDEPRRIADERCLVATRAREGAQAALESLSSAQRAYDEHESKAQGHTASADPRAVRAAKEAAQQAFRVARSAGRTRDDVETAARDWLTEINRINLGTREATAQAERHRVAATELASNLERLSVEADAARISAESAEEGCVAAREAVAACQEAAAILVAGGRMSRPPTAPPPGHATLSDESLDDESSMGSRAGEDAVIIRLLRGDREALNRLVARLGGDDPEERRRWQKSIGELLDAFVARSMEASAFDFPTDHPFWGTLTKSQCRDIAAGLSSLGYRHDGFGSWADDHMPTRRDLTLAVGYAGLDPFRIRHWPSEDEMRDLLRQVTVAADEYVWEAAGTLTLGELVSMLGRRADPLTELWNEWGIVRPLLLAVE